MRRHKYRQYTVDGDSINKIVWFFILLDTHTRTKQNSYYR